MWKKEDELKQLKSELAALDRKIQRERAPPTPEVAEKENEGQQLKPEAEDVRNRQAQYLSLIHISYEGKPSRTVLRGEEGSNVLDLPDRPSDLQQRDGRGVRAGN